MGAGRGVAGIARKVLGLSVSSICIRNSQKCLNIHHFSSQWRGKPVSSLHHIDPFVQRSSLGNENAGGKTTLSPSPSCLPLSETNFIFLMTVKLKSNFFRAEDEMVHQPGCRATNSHCVSPSIGSSRRRGSKCCSREDADIA